MCKSGLIKVGPCVQYLDKIWRETRIPSRPDKCNINSKVGIAETLAWLLGAAFKRRIKPVSPVTDSHPSP
jgi:hypothetical protein